LGIREYVVVVVNDDDEEGIIRFGSLNTFVVLIVNGLVDERGKIESNKLKDDEAFFGCSFVSELDKVRDDDA
jgi:hypothetical protein